MLKPVILDPYGIALLSNEPSTLSTVRSILDPYGIALLSNTTNINPSRVPILDPYGIALLSNFAEGRVCYVQF